MAFLINSFRFGAPAFAPTDIAGLQLWLDANDASTFTYSSGSVVSQWNDKSGTSNHVTQGTVANQPTRTVTINGINAVDFDGTNDFMVTADPGSDYALPLTYFAVVQPDVVTGGASKSIVGTGYNVNGAAGYIGNSVLGLYAGTVRTGGTVAAATPYVFQWTTDGASSSARISGGTSVISASPGTTAPRGYAIGATGSATSPLNGRIGEVTCYSGALSLANVNLVGQYLATKWGITWTTAT